MIDLFPALARFSLNASKNELYISPISRNFETTRNSEICVQRREIHRDIDKFIETSRNSFETSTIPALRVVSKLREIGDSPVGAQWDSPVG
jgi:hypothetical protein